MSNNLIVCLVFVLLMVGKPSLVSLYRAYKKRKMILETAAYLDLEDRGEIAASQGMCMACARCRHRARVGFLLVEECPVTWCYVCKITFDEHGDDDDDESSLPPDTPPSEGEPVPPFIQNETKKLLTKLRREKV